MQNNNLLKKAMLALLLCVAMPCLNAQVHVGDILCEGNLIYPPSTYPVSGATAIGVIFYVDDTGQHGWAVALQDAGSYKWGMKDSDTPLPNYSSSSKRQAIYDLDGYTNTLIVRQHNANHPAFYAVDFENGWYVPAIGQLNYLYSNIIEVNKSLSVAGGTKFSTSWTYWSSTECNSIFAWFLKSSGDLAIGTYNTSGGYVSYYDHKDTAFRVRGVRNF